MKSIPFGKLQFHTLRELCFQTQQRTAHLESCHLKSFISNSTPCPGNQHMRRQKALKGRKSWKEAFSLLGTAGQWRRAGTATLSRVTALRLVIILSRRFSGNLKRPARQRRFLHNKDNSISSKIPTTLCRHDTEIQKKQDVTLCRVLIGKGWGNHGDQRRAERTERIRSAPSPKTLPETPKSDRI